MCTRAMGMNRAYTLLSLFFIGIIVAWSTKKIQFSRRLLHPLHPRQPTRDRRTSYIIVQVADDGLCSLHVVAKTIHMKLDAFSIKKTILKWSKNKPLHSELITLYNDPTLWSRCDGVANPGLYFNDFTRKFAKHLKACLTFDGFKINRSFPLYHGNAITTRDILHALKMEDYPTHYNDLASGKIVIYLLHDHHWWLILPHRSANCDYSL